MPGVTDKPSRLPGESTAGWKIALLEHSWAHDLCFGPLSWIKAMGEQYMPIPHWFLRRTDYLGHSSAGYVRPLEEFGGTIQHMAHITFQSWAYLR